MYICEYDAFGRVSDEGILSDYDTGKALLTFRSPLRFQGQDEEWGSFTI
ncbi:hypothetical protein [Intestinirhabdus alba]|jgi:hypothetical protein|nr:hypothetical protein [Intestinirhabdus alba]